MSKLRITNCRRCNGRSQGCRECDGRGRIQYDENWERVPLPTLEEEDGLAGRKYRLRSRCSKKGTK